jgi:DNA-binding LytR/AlgR family response regulator
MRNTVRVLDINQAPRIAGSRQPLTVKTLNLRLVVATSTGTHLIPFGDIVMCTADSNYCIIDLTDGKRIMASKTLKYIESKLPEQLFFRTHQSHLVNKSCVRFVAHDHVLLGNGRNVPVARRRVAELKLHWAFDRSREQLVDR